MSPPWQNDPQTLRDYGDSLPLPRILQVAATPVKWIPQFIFFMVNSFPLESFFIDIDLISSNIKQNDFPPAVKYRPARIK
jgi:hypothetical protein